MQTSLDKALVRDVMTKKVFAVAPDTSIETAARMLTLKRVSGAPVISTSGHIVGVVSLADLADPDKEHSPDGGHSQFYRLEDGLARVLGDGLGDRPGRVDDVMTRPALTIVADSALTAAAHLILRLGVHRLLVVNASQQLIGIVSVVDVLGGLVAREQASSGACNAAPS